MYSPVGFLSGEYIDQPEHPQKGRRQNCQVLLHGTAESRESLAYRRIQQRQ